MTHIVCPNKRESWFWGEPNPSWPALNHAYITIRHPLASHFFGLCLWNLGSDCNWGQDHRGLVWVQIGCRDDQPDLDIFVEGSLQTNQIDASKQRMQAGPNSWCCEKRKPSSLFHPPIKMNRSWTYITVCNVFSYTSNPCPSSSNINLRFLYAMWQCAFWIATPPGSCDSRNQVQCVSRSTMMNKGLEVIEATGALSESWICGLRTLAIAGVGWRRRL